MAGDRHYMNPQVGRHMSGSDGDEHGGSSHPHIFIHSHSKGHTVHIHHPDGRHEKHEHSAGDAEGLASHIHTHIGGGVGQDHGYSSGEGMEDELGSGSGV